ncbi:hypothetical protein F0Q45_19250 [Mycobacterium simiae]|uniref:Uncharacterized protein n=1 Tax=Mycobacterium simiae TaxID=1784 RepID=A0A5B1BNU6_MYCSI|nr:hypothetical protein [Mycobacterium simiae]KAA1248679.1 hypothetical protein F0Q45_19250 [Mycobacterium simiae]
MAKNRFMYRIRKKAADQKIVEFIAEYNGVSRDVVKRLMHKYLVKAAPDRYAHLPNSGEPTSQVLTMSYAELDSALTEGLGVAK